MLAHSHSLLNLKRDAQQVHDFIILNCHAIPAYKLIHKEHAESKREFIPRPDHFYQGKICHDRVRELAKDYKSPLANYALLSLFSFFESYVKEVVKELFKFHTHDYLESLGDRLKARADVTATTIPHKKLRVRPNKKKRGRHIHLVEQLKAIPDSISPTELFAAYGVTVLKQRMGNDFDRLKANDIPDLLNDAFLYKMSESDSTQYNSIRDMRNSIAHGNSDDNLSLGTVIGHNDVLRKLAIDIDQHLLKHFFVIENP